MNRITDTAFNMMEQLYPNGIDRQQSVEDNMYNLIGYENPASDLPSVFGVGTGGVLTGETINDEQQQLIDSIARWSLNEERSQEQSNNDFLPAAAKAFYASQGFADNIGTWIQTSGPQMFLNWENGWGDWIAEAVASDIQFGIHMDDTRGGNWGLYGEHVSATEKYGPNWKDMTPEQRRRAADKHHAKQVEKYWSGIGDHPIGTPVGGLGGQLFDVSMMTPTGYVGLVAKFGGTTAAKLAGGAAVGASWAAAEEALDSYIRENEVDPTNVMKHAVFGAGFGMLLPVIGDFFGAAWTKHRQSGNQTKVADIEDLRTTALSVEQAKLKQMQELPKPTDPEELYKAEAMLKMQEARVRDLTGVSSEEITNTMNAATRDGNATDNQRIIDDGLRWHAGRQEEAIDYHKVTDRMNRAEGEEVAKVIGSPEYNRLTPEEQEQIATYVDIRMGNEPGATNNKVKKKASEIIEEHQQRLVDTTEKHLSILKEHGRDYKQSILREAGYHLASMGATGGTSYALTGDEEFALQVALATGAIQAGSRLGGKMYASYTSDLKARLNHPDEAIRIKANEDLKLMKWKSRLLGTSPTTNNDWFTVPARQWAARGGVGKVLARDIEQVTENIKLGISTKLARYGSSMATHNITKAEGQTVSRILSGQIKKGSPQAKGVEQRLFDAAADIRKLYNKELRESQKLGIYSKAEVDEMIKRAETNGYFNRVYDVDYLATEKGAAHFADVLSKAEISEKDALSIVESITGLKAADARHALTEVVKPGPSGQFVLDPIGIRKMMQRRRGVALRSKHLEKERVLSDKLENALDPFLIRDLDTAVIRYFESTTNRMEHVRSFGLNNEKGAAYRKQVFKETKDAQLAEQAEADILGAQFDPANKYLTPYFNMSSNAKRLTTIMQHFQNSKLIASAPLNLTQHVVYAPTKMMQMGLSTGKASKAMLNAYGASFKEIGTEVQRRGLAGQKFVNDFGVMADAITFSATGDIIAAQPQKKLGAFMGIVRRPDVWLRYSGFHSAEMTNRRVAGHAGKFIIDDHLARKQMLQSKGKLSSKEQTELNNINSVMVELGLNPTIPLGNHTIRSLDDAATVVANDLLRDPNLESSRRAAAQALSNKTNFQSDFMHKPREWHGPVGQWFGKFRNFMLHAHAFVRDDVIRPLAKGDTRPLAAMAIFGGLSGAAVQEFRDFVRNDDYEYSNTEKLINSWMVTGALTGYAEAMSQAIEHPRNIGSFFLGPAFSDVLAYGTRMAESLSEAVLDGPDMELYAQLTAELAKDLTLDQPAVKYVSGLSTQLTGSPDWYETRGDKQRSDVSRAAGLGKSGLKDDFLGGSGL